MGGARFSSRPRAADTMVRRLNHRAYRQRLRYFRRLAEDNHPDVLLLVALFYHTALGLQVVIEDYVHSGAKLAVVIAVCLGCFALASAGIVATLRIAFSG